MKIGSASASVDEAQAEAILKAPSERLPRRLAVRRRRPAEVALEPEVQEEPAAVEVSSEELAPVEVEAPAAPAPEPEPERAPEPVVAAAPEPEPSPEPVPAPEPEPEPAVAVAEPKAEAAPEPVVSAAEEAPVVEDEANQAVETKAAADPKATDPKASTPEASEEKPKRAPVKPIATVPGAPKPARVKPVARVVRVIDADAIRSRLQAEGRRGFGRPKPGGAPPRGPNPGGPGARPGARPGVRPGVRPAGGQRSGGYRPGSGLGTGGTLDTTAPTALQRGPRRGAPRPDGKAKRKRRMSKKALLELQGEALLQRERHRLDEETNRQLPSASQRIIKVDGSIRVGELAHEMSVKAAEVVRSLFMNGMMVTLTQSIDFDTASLIAEEFGYIIEAAEATDDELLNTHLDTEDNLILRSPVVTVMGHVDHGKTSLLDKIREANVAVGEAGGITQHIGAYSVDCPAGAVTFLDTPGHAAFSAMRARGAKVTDLVVLVVAADDGIKPQTVEAIKHAQAANVPLLVALNKMDKEGARPDNILQELTAHQLVPEEWGGEVQVQKLSAKTGEGVGELLEKLALQAEVLELRANPDKPAVGSVVEAQLDRGRGVVATILVQAGTLKKGDIVIAGQHYGRVRAMYDDQGYEVLEAGPSFPVAVLGLNGVPKAGDAVNVTDEKIAKRVTQRRSMRSRETELAVGARINLES
ncbi:MAG: translation initiation factor IF-2, partial [Myxococcota bacterium]|nr:translation initiation factor IF-2 [Myxococcota bacterium]